MATVGVKGLKERSISSGQTSLKHPLETQHMVNMSCAAAWRRTAENMLVCYF